MSQSTAVRRPGRTSGIRLVRPEEIVGQVRSTFDAIARRAFEIFERDGQFGHELEHWFQAEGELFHPLHLEVTEGDNVLTVRAEIPGFAEKDIKISLEPRRLTITGKRETREAKKTKKTMYSEHCSNEVFRVVDLPREVDPSASGVRATYEQGVLTVILPEAVETPARTIKISPK